MVKRGVQAVFHRVMLAWKTEALVLDETASSTTGANQKQYTIIRGPAGCE